MIAAFLLLAGCKTGIDVVSSPDETGGGTTAVTKAITGTVELPSSFSVSANLSGYKAVDTSGVSAVITNFITGEDVGSVALAEDYTFSVSMTDEVVASMENPYGASSYLKINITDGDSVDLGNIMEVSSLADAIDTGTTDVTTTSMLDMAASLGCEATDEACIRNALTLAGQLFNKSEDISLLKVSLLKGSESDLTTNCLSREVSTVGAKMRWMRAIKFVTDKCFSETGVKFDQIVSAGGFADKDVYRRKFSTGMEKIGAGEQAGFNQLLRTYCGDLLKVDTVLDLSGSLFDQGGEMGDFIKGSFKSSSFDTDDVKAYGASFREMPPAYFNDAMAFEQNYFRDLQTTIGDFKSGGYINDIIDDEHKAAMFVGMFANDQMNFSDPATRSSLMQMTHTYVPVSGASMKDNYDFGTITSYAVEQYKDQMYAGSMDPLAINESNKYNMQQGEFNGLSGDDLKNKVGTVVNGGNECEVEACMNQMQNQYGAAGVAVSQINYEQCMQQCYGGGGANSISKGSVLKASQYAAADICGDQQGDEYVGGGGGVLGCGGQGCSTVYQGVACDNDSTSFTYAYLLSIKDFIEATDSDVECLVQAEYDTNGPHLGTNNCVTMAVAAANADACTIVPLVGDGGGDGGGEALVGDLLTPSDEYIALAGSHMSFDDLSGTNFIMLDIIKDPLEGMAAHEYNMTQASNVLTITPVSTMRGMDNGKSCAAFSADDLQEGVNYNIIFVSGSGSDRMRLTMTSEMDCYAELGEAHVTYFEANFPVSAVDYFKTGNADATYTIQAELNGSAGKLGYDQLNYLGFKDVNDDSVATLRDSFDSGAWVRSGDVISNCTSVTLPANTLYQGVAFLASSDDLGRGYSLIITIVEGSDACAE